MNKKEYINPDDNDTGADNRGKFADRIKQIRRDKVKRNEDKEENFLIRGGRNVFKIFLALPSMAYSVIKSSDKKKDLEQQNNDVVNVNKKQGVIIRDSKTNMQFNKYSKGNIRYKVNKIKEIDVKVLRKEKELLLKQKPKIGVSSSLKSKNNAEDSYQSQDNRVEELQKEIIKLIKNINELEILYSELYLIKEVSGEDLYLDKCRDDIKEIKKLLSKIKSLKEKYDYLKGNIDFNDIFEYDDELLADKILELKAICSDQDLKNLIDNYKILDEYKFLYLKIDQLQNNVILYEEYKKQKEEELKQRDIDLEQLKQNIFNVDGEFKKYNDFVKNQEQLLGQLDENVANISSHEEVTYRLKGFGQLLGNSFKYLGLLLLNPLKGLIPGIAVQTMITRNTVKNLRKKIEWEVNKKIVYDAIDYSHEIDDAINNLDNNLSFINMTLDEIVELKYKYNRHFEMYPSSKSDYKDVMSKLNKIENSLLNNKIKIKIMQKRMEEKKKTNAEKLQKVKKLNCSTNN